MPRPSRSLVLPALVLHSLLAAGALAPAAWSFQGCPGGYGTGGGGQSGGATTTGTAVTGGVSTGAGRGSVTTGTPAPAPGGPSTGAPPPPASTPPPAPAGPTGPSTGGPKLPPTSSPTGAIPLPTSTPAERPKDKPRTPTADVDDRSSWETWWLFNRDALLDLHQRVQEKPLAGDDGITGTRAPRVGLLPAADLEKRVLPMLEKLLATETNPEVLEEVLVALARVAHALPGLDVSPRAALVQAALAHPQQQVGEAAAIALGILGESANARALLELARDTATGRELCARREVPYRLRAFATYSVGLIAAQAKNEDVRRFAASGLIALLADGRAPRDVQVACVSALGVARLASVPDTWQASVKRTARELEPTASREALIAHLTQCFANPRQAAVVRAHALTALARLAAGAAAPVQDEVEELCVRALDPAAREPNEVVQSAALALGLVSDAGDQPRDREARIALMSAAHQADLDTRHFAILALGQIAARPDEDAAAPFAGTAEVHRFLMRELEHGRSGVRSFAALALGWCGRALREQGRTPSADATRAIATRLKDANGPDEVSACALALGLRGDEGTTEMLRDRLADASDDLTRSGCAVGLGLAGAAEARGLLQRQCAGAAARPAFLREAAIALALLGDRGLSSDLCKQLQVAPGSAAQIGVLQALSEVGNLQALDTLLATCSDASKSAQVRARALTALGSVCDPRRLPWNECLTRGANYLASVETLTDNRGDGILDLR